MVEMHTIVAILGIGLALVILYLIRRGHLHLRDGLFWILAAAFSILLGIWPALIDRLSGAVGIAYSPALLFLVAIIILLLRLLLLDIAYTQMKLDLRRLNQKLALHEAEDDHDDPT